LVRLHQTLKLSPAMAARVTNRLWEMTDVVEVLDAFEAKVKRQPKVTIEMAESSADRWEYESKIAQRFGFEQQLELPIPLPIPRQQKAAN